MSNKVQIIQNLLFNIKSNPKGLLFLQEKYGVDFGSDLYPEITAIKLHKVHGKEFDKDLVFALGGLYERKIIGFSFTDANDWNKLVENVSDAIDWSQDVLDNAETGTNILDAAVVSDDEKQEAAEKLEAVAKQEAEEAEKVKQQNKQLLYTAIGVIVILTILIFAFKKLK